MMRFQRDEALRGRVALVTGAGRGIGRGAAVGLAVRGASVAVLDIVEDELAITVDLLKQQQADVVAVRADLRGREHIDRALDEVGRLQGLPDILINNAAVLRLEPFEETEPDVWDETLRVNLDAAYYLTWRLYPSMVSRGEGNIVTVSSTAGVKPFARETAYCASKYALEGLFRSLALEATAHGVMVTLCAPGTRTKPTSMTEAEFAGLAAEEREGYAPPTTFAEAFGYLAASREPMLAGRRFDLAALSGLVREQGWVVSAGLALERAAQDGS